MKTNKNEVQAGSVFLNRDLILSADDLKVERFDVPEWNGYIFLKTMTGTERDAFEKSVVKPSDEGEKSTTTMENFRAKLCALTICNEKGKLLFSMSDVEALGGKSSAAISRIFDAAAALNGIGKKDAEELVKNSKPGQNEG